MQEERWRRLFARSAWHANDLAIRLAWAHSGKRNILCLLEAYHGWTVASDAVSTSIADNPQALTTRPDWVHPVLSPNTYRGPFRGPDSGHDYLNDVTAKLQAIDEKGDGLAGFIAEPVYGNAGGIEIVIGDNEPITIGAVGEIVRDLPLVKNRLRERF